MMIYEIYESFFIKFIKNIEIGNIIPSLGDILIVTKIIVLMIIYEIYE